MGTRRVRIRAVVSCAIALALCPAAAGAEEVSKTFAELQGRIMIGETITATDKAGQVTKGKLASITPTELTLNVQDGPRTLPGNALAKVQARRSGPLWNGALIGAAVAAAPVIGLAAGCGDCEVNAGAALVIGIGAGIGAGIDALWKGNVTVMQVGQEKKVSLAPLVTKGRKGVLCSVRF